MSFSKHNVWEMSRDISAFFAGDERYKEAAAIALERQQVVSEEDKAEIALHAGAIKAEAAALQEQLAVTAALILETEELPKNIAEWREADLTKYIAAAQKYEVHELLVGAVLAAPNISLMFDFLEPANDE